MANSILTPPPDEALSNLLPPLIFGTATFNSQYNPDPYKLPTTELVHDALRRGIRGFDTSPYYGPSEELLGRALDTAFVHDNFPRDDIFILTKCGRISSTEFDYSRAWVRKSVDQSLKRLRTSYLDVVYCHDVEFVSAEECLEAVTELRRIRAETGKIKYIGISGYPVEILCERAEMILEQTGEPLDAVMSYANYTLQSSRLYTKALHRLKAAKVEVVPNASVLGMGLLRRNGIPIGSMGDWHPAPNGLRKAVAKAADYCDHLDDKLEKVAIRHSLESWLEHGAEAGSRGDPASGLPWKREHVQLGQRRLGVSVMGVSTMEELEETMRVWHSILDTLGGGEFLTVKTGRNDREWGLQRRAEVKERSAEIKEILGPWLDHAWASPDEGFLQARQKKLAAPGSEDAVSEQKC